MNQKAKIKMGIDLVMTILLLCQMAYMLIGETAHEWLGTAMFLPSEPLYNSWECSFQQISRW